jgi:hypothetical protein
MKHRLTIAELINRQTAARVITPLDPHISPIRKLTLFLLIVRLFKDGKSGKKIIANTLNPVAKVL